MNSVIDEYYMTNSTQIFPRIFECVNGELPLGIFYSNCCFATKPEKRLSGRNWNELACLFLVLNLVLLCQFFRNFVSCVIDFFQNLIASVLCKQMQ